MNTYFKETKLPKSMPKNEREALVAELKELLRIAKMEGASFDSGNEIAAGNTFTTDLIKAKTRLYRETWLIYPIEALIDRYELPENKKEVIPS